MRATTGTRVVVGIDGSDRALAAVRVAAAEAWHRDETLHIVHAFIWPIPHAVVGPVAGDLSETGLVDHAEELLEEAMAEAGEAAPCVPVTTALIDGAATPVLLAEADRATRTPGYLAELMERGHRTLGESLAGWQDRYPDVVVRPELAYGHPRKILVERSRTAQLMVLGARGRDIFEGQLLGSVSQALLHHSGCPVSVVRETGRSSRGRRGAVAGAT
jgi:nucleotide-binding universal stress UspA family protein